MKAISLEESLRMKSDYAAAEEVAQLRFRANTGKKALDAMAALHLLDALREMLALVPHVDDRLHGKITSMSETLRTERNRMLDYVDAHKPSNVEVSGLAPSQEVDK